MRKIDRRIVVVAALIFIVVLAYGLMRYLISLKEEPPMRPPDDARRFVQTDTVHYETRWTPVSAPGRLLSISELDLVAEASGKIITGKVPLKKGAQFRKGDLLFTIYPDEARLELQARKSLFLNSLANLLPDLAIDFPEDEQSFQSFFNNININQKLPEFPEIRNEKLKVFLAGRNIYSEYLYIERDELQLQRRELKAPFDGTYKEVYLEAGAYTNTGGRIATAIRTDKMELEVPLDRFDADWVETGDQVKVHSDRGDHTWTGRVIRKNQFVEPNTQSQGVFIEVFNNTEPLLLPGEYLHAEFDGHPVEGVMEIPRNAVLNNDEVFVVVNERLEKRRINIVKKNESTLLFNGLKENVILVTQPLINVMEGTSVSTSKTESAGKQGKAKK